MFFVIFKMFFAFVIINAEVNNSNNLIEQATRKNENVTKAIKINFSNASVVSEMQYTVCSIRNEDVEAKAQSTSSRILTGVCTSEEILRALKNMEDTFLKKLEQVQQTLIAFIQSKYQPVALKETIQSSKLSTFKVVDSFFNKNVLKNYT